MEAWSLRAGQVVRLCLQISIIPNADLNPELDSVSRRLSADLPAVGGSAGVDAFTGDDAHFWGEAVGYMFAAGIYRCIPKNFPTGEMLTLRLGDSVFKFAPPMQAKGAPSLRDDWLDEAWNCIRRISIINTQFEAFRAVSLFSAVGPTRTNETNGRFVSKNPLFNILGDLYRSETVFLNNEAAWAFWDGV